MPPDKLTLLPVPPEYNITGRDLPEFQVLISAINSLDEVIGGIAARVGESPPDDPHLPFLCDLSAALNGNARRFLSLRAEALRGVNALSEQKHRSHYLAVAHERSFSPAQGAFENTELQVIQDTLQKHREQALARSLYSSLESSSAPPRGGGGAGAQARRPTLIVAPVRPRARRPARPPVLAWGDR